MIYLPPYNSAILGKFFRWGLNTITDLEAVTSVNISFYSFFCCSLLRFSCCLFFWKIFTVNKVYVFWDTALVKLKSFLNSLWPRNLNFPSCYCSFPTVVCNLLNKLTVGCLSQLLLCQTLCRSNKTYSSYLRATISLIHKEFIKLWIMMIEKSAQSIVILAPSFSCLLKTDFEINRKWELIRMQKLSGINKENWNLTSDCVHKEEIKILF